ncbi:MAG: hypothetical protein IT307_17480 [Chloroflexi bacterium]|nr:hypothetical protein [Chloroflexota bacterium]
MERTNRLLLALYGAATVAGLIAVGFALLALSQLWGGGSSPTTPTVAQEILLAVGLPVAAVCIVVWAMAAGRAMSHRRRPPGTTGR